MNTANTTARPIYLPVPSADGLMGAAYIVCFLAGLPGNILAVAFFHQDKAVSPRKEFFRLLFLLLAYLNLVTCATLPPLVELFFRDRQGTMFQTPWFCWCWGVLWEFIPFCSVFLLGVMSISRMITLLLPFRQLNMPALLASLGVYTLYTVLVKTLPLVTDTRSKYFYSHSAGFCFLYTAKGTLWNKLYNMTNVVQLGAPFIPILLSCVSSICLVYHRPCSKQQSTQKVTLRRKSSTRLLLENATVTIIVMTVVYLLFNLPVFVNYSYYVHWVRSGKSYATFYGSVFLYRYLWNISYVLCMAGNAAVNPAVYFWRIAAFKAFVWKLLGREGPGKAYRLVAVNQETEQ